MKYTNENRTTLDLSEEEWGALRVGDTVQITNMESPKTKNDTWLMEFIPIGNTLDRVRPVIEESCEESIRKCLSGYMDLPENWVWLTKQFQDANSPCAALRAIWRRYLTQGIPWYRFVEDVLRIAVEVSGTMKENEKESGNSRCCS